MANKIPSWCPDAIPTTIGWADPITGEQLTATSGLENPISFYKPNAKEASFIDVGDGANISHKIVSEKENIDFIIQLYAKEKHFYLFRELKMSQAWIDSKEKNCFDIITHQYMVEDLSSS